MKQQEMFSNAVWMTSAEAAENVSRIYVLRGKFSVRNVKKAVLRVIGLGFFHCYINGRRVGEDLFLPLNSDYETRPDYPCGETLSGHRIYVPEYDVTDYLRDGENVIAVHFGGGWYTFAYNNGFGEPKAIWRVFGEDENGAFEEGSSENDIICRSFVSSYDFTKTETQNFDADASELVGDVCDTSAFERAVPAKQLDTEYELSKCPADRVIEQLSARVRLKTAECTVYDCGRNISGYPVLDLCAEKGEEVRVVFSEELLPDGNLDMRYNHLQDAVFISDGKKRRVHPLFTWYGFRYFAVFGNAEVVNVDIVHSNVEKTAYFSCDNEFLNWLHSTYVNTQLMNMHAGIPSDCPHIERRGYTGDGQLTCHAVMNIFDAKEFYRKWMRDIADCQDVKTGHIQYTAPYIRSGGGPGGWGCAIVEVPYMYYIHYGDSAVLSEYYPYMLKYFEYLEAHSSSKLVVSDKEGEWCLGEWCTPESVILPAPFVNNYFYIKSLMRCIDIAKVIGKQQDIPMFEARIKERKAALVDCYYNSWDGNFLGGAQGANAFAVDIGLGDERTYGNLVEYYKKLRRFDTGIFGTDIVTRVLFERGDADLACSLLLSDDDTSFFGMKNRGATTFWEYFPNSLDERSHNHPMFGAVIAYFYDYLLGIRTECFCAAYDEVIISPAVVDGINHVSGHRVLPSGKVSVSYTRVGTKTEFVVTVPKGQKATFVCSESRIALSDGINNISICM